MTTHPIIKGKNDLASQKPILLKLWDYNKNTLPPDEVSANSTQLYHWVCDKGHTWEKDTHTMKESFTCPYCSGRKALAGFNDLYSQFPEVAKLWIEEENGKSPKEVVITSTSPLYHWRCPNGYDHTYTSSVKNAVNGVRCPYCANYKTLQGFNDLESQFPKLAKEYSDENKIPAYDIRVTSTATVKWECENGHKWENTVRNRVVNGQGCSKCKGRKVDPGVNDLFTKHPELIGLFIPELNPEIDPHRLMPHSQEMITWQCDVNPDHVWNRTPSKMLTGSGKCPHCSKVWIPGTKNVFIEEYPNMAAQYSSKNTYPLENLMPKSNINVIWECEKGHEWSTTANARTTRNSGCPYCSGKKAIPGETDLATVYPDIMVEWDYEKNDLDPSTIKYHSSSQAWWVCKVCDHSWQAGIYSRVKNGSGCPRCTGRVPHVGYNDLATLRPDVLKYWSDKNTLLPTEVKPGSGVPVIWECDEGHEWECNPYTQLREDRVSFCPKCSTAGKSNEEEEIFNMIAEKLGDTLVRHNDRTVIRPREIDIYVPEYSFGIEYNGLYYHTESSGKDKYYHYDKWKSCKDKGISLFTLWDFNWKQNRDVSLHVIRAALGLIATYHEDITAPVAITRPNDFFAKYSPLDESSSDHYAGIYDNNGNLISASAWSVEDDHVVLDKYAFSTYHPDMMETHISYGVELAKSENLSSIYVYVNNDYPWHEDYEKCGFMFDHAEEPTYLIRSNNKLISMELDDFLQDDRYIIEDGFNLEACIDANKLDRVWDCGVSVYRYDFS